jgi:hypothetical protein
MSLRAPVIDAPAGPARAPRAVHTVLDLFSGAGGMSCGFHRHPAFAVVGAADAEIGKPSSGTGTLGCNASFRRNIGVEPLALDLGTVAPEDLRDRLALAERPVVLSACAPCTGFSRMLARNHVVDDARNSLVVRVGTFARAFRPEVIVMENARELLMGRCASASRSSATGSSRRSRSCRTSASRNVASAPSSSPCAVTFRRSARATSGRASRSARRRRPSAAQSRICRRYRPAPPT